MRLQIALAVISAAAAAAAYQPGKVANTPVTEANVDRANCTVWQDGKPLAEGAVDPGQVLFRADGNCRAPYGESFGTRAVESAVHQRYAFTEALPVGSVFAQSRDRISVLKPDAPYPGDLGDDSQWIPGEQLAADGSQMEGRGEPASIWTFPAGIVTRALRITHVPEAKDRDQRGSVNGLLVFRERYANLARYATARSATLSKRAARLNNGRDDGLNETWSNVDGSVPEAELPVVDKAHPGVFTLSWPEPVSFDAFLTLHTGFGACEVDVLSSDCADPAFAKESDWIFEKAFSGLDLNFPWCTPNTLRLDRKVTTRAVRFRLTDRMECGHEHVRGQNRRGKRVYLGEILVLNALGAGESLEAPAFVKRLNAKIEAPVAIPFSLPAPGRVTLVLEKDGKRICNLVSDRPFPAGDNVFHWDGSDDLGRDLDAAGHGVYNIPTQLVAPGTYTVRGLYHGDIFPSYEFGVYAPGTWKQGDPSSHWLANHTPPQAAAYVDGAHTPDGRPLMFFGAMVTEGPDGLIWTDLDGHKQGGLRWIGGNWLSAPFIASDSGPQARKDVAVYVAGVFDTGDDRQGSELRITTLAASNPRQMKVIGRYDLGATSRHLEKIEDRGEMMRGVTALNGRLALSVNKLNEIWLVDGRTGSVERKLADVVDPRGLVWDPADGRLYVLSGKALVKLAADGSGEKATLVEGFEDPTGIALGPDGAVYVSDRGACHQVKVYDRTGRLLRTVGNRGTPQSGPYDPNHLNNPYGIAVTPEGRLWVTECDYLPKRVSAWDAEGRLVFAEYGPGKYGEGGTIDGTDPSRFYYAEQNGTLEFTVDWRTGESRLVNVLARDNDPGFKIPGGYGDWGGSPETPVYAHGNRYLSNSHNNSPIVGPETMTVCLTDGKGRMRPCVSLGEANNCRYLKQPVFADLWPEGEKRGCFYLWCDANGDGDAQPSEVVIRRAKANCPMLMDDMAITIGDYNGSAVRLRPEWVDGSPVPRYSLDRMEVLCRDVYRSMSDGGNQVLADDSDEVVMCKGAKPFSPYSFTGAKNGEAVWSYPNLWPGLHASHNAPSASEPGELIGPVRTMGGFMKPAGSEVAPVWFMSGNVGAVYVFTRDGLFVTSLFGDERTHKGFGAGEGRRGTPMRGQTINGENFWTTASCTKDGQVYMVCRNRILKVNGLGTLRPIAPFPLTVDADTLAACREYRVALEQQRRAREGSGVLKARVVADGTVKADGDLADWKGAETVDIEQQGVSAWFDSDSKPYDVKGALAADAKNLYVLWQTGNARLIDGNTAENPDALFKTGGCLDLMLGTDSGAPAKRGPADGDLRLLVTKVAGKVRALVYRQKCSGADPACRVDFVSPVRSVAFDRIEDVSAKVAFGEDGKGGFEIAVPLDVLGLTVAPGAGRKADLGILRAADGHVNARRYWANKSTAITADLPSEAELTPSLWGDLVFVKE